MVRRSLLQNSKSINALKSTQMHIKAKIARCNYGALKITGAELLNHNNSFDQVPVSSSQLTLLAHVAIAAKIPRLQVAMNNLSTEVASAVT
eukprot:6351446-Amphidinium_carterae.1